MPTVTANDDRKVIPSTPPLNWRREMPRYRVRAETKPAPKTRFRFEPPFASQTDSDVWQYGERVWPAESIIETDQWPCAGTFVPLNFAAREVLNFFNSRQKSRLPRSPWANDQVRLDDGLTGPMPKIRPPVQPDQQPARVWPGM